MDPPPNQEAAGVNLTRALEALSPYLNHPRQTVVRIEAFVLVAVGLLFLQLLLGSIRRWCGNWFVQGALWLAYTASFPLITYTLGQMVSSPIKNALYPIWALFLFWAAGCTHSIIAYDLEDNKSWKRHLFELIQYLVYLSILERLLNPNSNSIHFKELKNQQVEPISTAVGFLSAVLFYANVVRLIAGWMVTNSAPSKFVADYMRKQANQPESFNPDPVTMKGYKYLVWWPRLKENHLRAGFSSSNPITIDKIWEMQIDSSLLNSNKGGLGVQDLCLSFSLSHLLKRRYFEMECVEASRLETRKFVLEGLLSEKEEDKSYTRAFKIIEVELGFLYDFFFTKYATLFHMEVTYLTFAVVKLISMAYCAALLLRNSPTLRTLDPVIEVGTRRVDVIITIIIMASFLAVEALQLILYVTSDWATISLACLCISRIRNSKQILSLIKFIRRFKFIKHPGYWQNKMGQSSVIASSMHFLPVSHFNKVPDLFVDAIGESITYIFSVLFPSMIFSGKTFIQVHDLVKREIVSCLKEYKYNVDDPLTNGQRALSRHGVLGKFSWTLENQSQISIMLVWHIATEYCSMPSRPSELEKEGGTGMFAWHQICCGFWTKEKESSGNQQVATTLSRYCAYLMSTAPDLLPGNSTDTLFIFECGVWHGRKLLCGRKPSKEILMRAIQGSERRSSEGTPTSIHDSRGNDNDISINVHDSSNDNNDDDSSTDTTTKHDDIFTQGLKLGRQLEEEIEDEDVRWRVMAEFWAETIVYIAPSDNSKAHMERLAQGGEFLTHVWALLTQAGILQRGNKEMETP